MTIVFWKSHVLLAGFLTFAVSYDDICSAREKVGVTRPVDKDPSNRFEHLARSIGRFEIGDGKYTRSCTAAIISRDYILTLDRCARKLDSDSWSSFNASFRLPSSDGGSKIYQVTLPPVERNEQLGFAVLGVEGDPAADFEVARLMVRDPRPNERVLLFQEGASTPIEFISNCTVLGVKESTLTHSCEASVGSAGALLFSEADEAVLGLVDRIEGKGGWLDSAHSMSGIARASPVVGAVAYIKALPLRVTDGHSEEVPVALQDGLPEDIPVQSFVLLNGKKERVTAVDAGRRTMTLLGDNGTLKQGLNVLETARQKLIFWNEQRVLSAFANPYPKSYAVIVAIDDYDRKSDSQHRPATRYPRLANMRERAEELRTTLERVGFLPNNIFTLYDQEATAKNIDEKLGEFWQGGSHADADRLFFYFGGHGDGEPGSGYLVTYDIDEARPTRTGFLMSDFVTRHFPNIRAHHVLVALDSCASGLAIPGRDTLGGALDNELLKRFATLNAIRNDTNEKARNVLVAGTDEQRALWETGGIFTQALIEGLQGDADLIRDGVIQFDELSLFIERRVTARAAEVGVRQNPHSFLAELYGRGKMLFILPDRK